MESRSSLDLPESGSSGLPGSQGSWRTLLVLGGARSGKSRRALEVSDTLRQSCPGGRTFVATATAGDKEMADRIARHRMERAADWALIEEPGDLPAIISRTSADSLVLVDCLTLWLSSLLMAKSDFEAATAGLESAIIAARGRIILVSNETGWGVVPPSDLGRQFRDAQGRLNQRLAAICDRVELVVAGLPLAIKAGSPS